LLFQLDRKRVHRFSVITKDDSGMSESLGGVQITQGIEFPVWFVHDDEELFDTFERKLPPFDKDFDRVAAHDGSGHITERVRERG
jgi:hypothetical protein